MESYTYEQLREYFYREGEPSGHTLNKKEHKWFKKAVKEAASFLDDLPGEKKFSLYLKCVLEDITSPPPCAECGLPVKGVRKTKFNDYCSTECFAKGSEGARHATFEENGGHPMHRKEIRDVVAHKLRHGDKSKSYRKKRKESHEASYGVNGATFRKPKTDAYGNEFHNQTEWYGGFHPNSITDGAKASITWLRNAVETKGKTKEQIDRRWKRHMYLLDLRTRKRGVHHSQKHIPDEINRLLEDKETLEELYEYHGSVGPLADTLGISTTTMNRALHNLDIPIKQGHRVSHGEIQVRNFIAQFVEVDDLLCNDRSHGFEADCIIPSKNIAVEYNGIYYHSSPNKPRMHHQKKSIDAAENGYKMIHVWEEDWNDPVKREIVKSRIMFNMGIFDKVYARKCKVRKDLSTKELRDFFDRNHIQGFVSSSYHAALEYEGRIVACVMIKKARGREGVYELTRFVTDKDTQVMGGFTKCLKHVLSDIDYEEVFTYASLDYSNGNSYEMAGFEKVGITPPGMFYTKYGKRYNRRQFMKKNLKNKLKEFDPSLTERENMSNHGFNQLYDSGSIKYVMKNE